MSAPRSNIEIMKSILKVFGLQLVQLNLKVSVEQKRNISISKLYLVAAFDGKLSKSPNLRLTVRYGMQDQRLIPRLSNFFCYFEIHVVA